MTGGETRQPHGRAEGVETIFPPILGDGTFLDKWLICSFSALLYANGSFQSGEKLQQGSPGRRVCLSSNLTPLAATQPANSFSLPMLASETGAAWGPAMALHLLGWRLIGTVCWGCGRLNQLRHLKHLGHGPAANRCPEEVSWCRRRSLK